MAESVVANMSLIKSPKPIITVKEARKLLPKQYTSLTNEEILEMLKEYEQIVRLVLREHLVRK